MKVLKIALIHISDIHFKVDTNKNYVLEKQPKIISAIRSDLYIEDECVFFLISGDTSFSGQKEEFEIALGFYSSLMATFSNSNLLLIPGNHDCDFTTPLVIRSMLKPNLKVDDINGVEIIEEITQPLLNYYDFSSLFKDKTFLTFSDKLFEQYRFTKNNHTIQINCINSASYSEKHEQAGDLLFPIGAYKKLLEQPANLAITMIHHPTHWFSPNNKRDIDDLIKENSDIIFTGHEHTNTNSKISDFSLNETIYFEGSALQTDIPVESSFSIIHLDLENETISKSLFSWSVEHNIYIKTEELVNHSLCTNKTLRRNGITFTTEYKNWLNDPGIMIKHPKVTDDILLEDIYVYPDAEIINYSQNSDLNDDFINLKDLLEFNTKKIMLIGGENYGKSSFCKIYIKEAIQKGYIPVKIDGYKLDKTDISEIRKIIKTSFIEQYGDSKVQEFLQYDPSKIIIVVEDIINSPLKSKFRIKLLNTLDKNFENVFITSREFIKYEEILVKDEEASYKDNFIFYEILALGNAKKGELILKWNNLGDQTYIDDKDKIKKIDHCESVINTIIGNNYVPSLPFFILTLLQTIESGDTNLKDSAYGFYYEYLIRNQLLNVKLSNEDLNTFNNYIAYLAFHAFTEKQKTFSKYELSSFHDKYKTDFGITKEFESYLKLLEQAAILVKTENNYIFKFNYVYYYYVAKYLADNLEDVNSGIDKLVSEISTKLYNIEYSNIIMFLSHLSKNPIILNNVLENATKIFNTFAPTGLADEIKPINELIVELPDLVIEHKDILEERQNRKMEADRLERMKASDDLALKTEVMEENSDTFDIVSNLNWAMKTVEIMGQILKNYYGSTKMDKKLSMTEELYNLSLRSLNAFLTQFVENKDRILLDLERIIKKQSITSDNKIQTTARNLVFGLTSAISLFFIKKVSTSAGTIDLEPVFREIKQSIPTTAVKLIDITIKLDHMYEIPFNDIEKLVKEVGDNPMVINMLRRIVINHLYMFPVSHRDRQKVVSILSLNQKQLGIATIKKQLIDQR
ncbi:hypothetical protein D7X33_18975 [Butyricicoccus sp. 1XD8-22]|nr:hypothetical protein D7X33_18975 [Butyricicoccus sp. 1XD8-22]